MAALLPAPVVPLRLPNFNLVTTNLREVVSELDHVSNMGPVQQAAALAQMQQTMNEMHRMLTGMTATVNGLTATVNGLTTDVRNLDAKIDTTKLELNGNINNAKAELNRNINNAKAELNRNIQNEGVLVRRMIDDLDFNTQARVYNSAATKVTCALRPLRNATTHELIQLPDTVAGLDELPKQEINELLLNLGQELSSADRTKDRLSQLKLFIGMHE